MIKRLMLVCCLYINTAYADVCPEVPSASIVGVATAASTGEFLYCESHYALGDSTRVEYKDSSQALIVLKQVDYSDGLLAPSIYQEDFRHGEKVRVQRLQNPVSDNEYLFMQYQRANEDEPLDKSIENVSGLVVDAGFDNAIRYYWDEMSKKGSVILTFVAPARLRTIKLKVRVKPLSSCRFEGVEDYLYEKSKHICYVVRPLNSMVSLFVKPIKLIYEQKTQRLVSFVGNSNVTDEKGSGQQVIITYRYF